MEQGSGESMVLPNSANQVSCLLLLVEPQLCGLSLLEGKANQVNPARVLYSFSPR